MRINHMPRNKAWLFSLVCVTSSYTSLCLLFQNMFCEQAFTTMNKHPTYMNLSRELFVVLLPQA